MATALIVEDLQSDREIYRDHLQNSGWQVVLVDSGESALDRIATANPDIIFLDVVLPGLSGFEICRTLKSQTATQHIPVVICSSKNTDMDRFWGLKQGADCYLCKPIDRNELLDTIQKLVK
jgi:chemotaxis family two-component system response regulator PixH